MLADQPVTEHALIRELVYGTLRFWHRLGARVAPLLRHPLRPRDRDIDSLLRLGAYQLEFLSIPAYAAVAATAEAARSLDKKWAVGLANAVLRRLAAQPVPPRWPGLDESSASHPRWLIEAVHRAWPADWDSILAAANRRPPFSIRVNARQTSRGDYQAELASAGLASRVIAHAQDGLELSEAVNVGELPGFAEGRVSVQDGAAQLAAWLVAPRSGERVLDACAAPGGKTAHLIERADCTVTALDVDAERTARITENLARLGLDAEVRAADAAAPESWWDGSPFDRILIDAPCTGTGVIRRHPDIKILRRPGDVRELAGQQWRLLTKLWPLLKRNGILVYATCSVLPEENALLVRDFLRATMDAELQCDIVPWARPAHPGWQVLPNDNGMDGFYYARLRKL